MKKEFKNIQTFEQHTDKNLNISDVSESKSNFNDYIKYLNNDINESLKLYIVKWFKNNIKTGKEVNELINDFEIQKKVEELSQLFLNNIDSKCEI